MKGTALKGTASQGLAEVQQGVDSPTLTTVLESEPGSALEDAFGGALIGAILRCHST